MAAFFEEFDDDWIAQQLLEAQQQEEQTTRAKVEQGRGVRREQDVAFLESLFTDQMNDLQKEREKQRQLITDLLKTKLPTNIMDLIPIEDQRLLRIRDIYLTPAEREYVRAIKEEITRLENGGCFDGNESPRFFKLRIPGIPIALCFDVEDILMQGLVNEDLNLADVNIELDETGELYRYPLTEDETKELLKLARFHGLNINQYPKMAFPEIEKTHRDLLEALAE